MLSRLKYTFVSLNYFFNIYYVTAFTQAVDSSPVFIDTNNTSTIVKTNPEVTSTSKIAVKCDEFGWILSTTFLAAAVVILSTFLIVLTLCKQANPVNKL